MPKQITGDEPVNPLKYKIPANQDATGAYFPEIEAIYPGLTIRQEFAARAMQALLSNPNTDMRTKIYFDNTIASCVKIADALIAELNKEV